MSGPAIAAPRTDMFNIRHDNTTINIQMIEDPEHPDYDARIELPVDDELKESIRMVGMLEPAIGYKGDVVDGCQFINLVVGRQRWKAVRSIWMEMLESGQDMSLAPAFKLLVQKSEDAGKRRQKRIIENRHRQELSGLALARELATHLEIVGNDEQSRESARILFNFKSLAAMDNCLALLDTTAKVQALVIDGTLSPTAALQLAHQPTDVQDRVADRIEAEGSDDLDESDSDDEGGVDPAQIDAFPSEASAPAPERASTPRQIPVSGVKEMIREETGKQAFALVTLKQIEKQIDKKEADLEKALTKLEDTTDQSKVADQSARVAGIQEYIKALRWARGENGASTAAGAPSAGNDKMSAAWDALRDAIVSANWPTITQYLRPEWEPSRRLEPDYESSYRKACEEARFASDDSHILFVLSEVAAIRSVTDRAATSSVTINVNSKWFTRLMDPFGNPSKLVRDWGAHGWIEARGKAAGLPNYKHRIHDRNGDQVLIRISPEQVARWVKGSEIGNPKPIETTVLRIVRSNIPSRSAAELTRESRFATPWEPANSDEDFVGPDLQEDFDCRDRIRDEIQEVFETEIIPEADRTWATVGDLIDYVEQKLSMPSADAEAA